MSDDFSCLDAIDLAALVRAREVNPSELLAWSVARTVAVNPSLNCVSQLFPDRAEAQIAHGLQGPLAGVPFLLKDSGSMLEGVPTTLGSLLWGDCADENDWLTQHYLDAGLVIFGKTNAPELGLSVATEPIRNGPARNPWNPAFSPGGSSGGAGAAVAAGIVPAAHGADGGGSIRIPASACGVFGLKPSRGRVTAGPHSGEEWNGLVASHALTRSVRDSALLLDIAAAAVPGEPYVAPAPTQSFYTSAQTSPPRLRIAFMTGKADAACARAAHDAALLCAQLGHHVEEGAPPYDEEAAAKHMRTIWAANAHAAVEGRRRALGARFHETMMEPVLRALDREGAELRAQALVAAIAHLHATGRAFAAFFSKWDVLISPVTAAATWRIGDYDMSETDLDRYFDHTMELVAFTPQFNITGQPAMSVPLGRTDDGMPVGVHFAARYGEESLLFSLASELEAAAPWIHRRPP